MLRMLLLLFLFFTLRYPCRHCRSEILWVRRECPDCGQEFPLARPAFYWVGVAIYVLGLVMVPLVIISYFK